MRVRVRLFGYLADEAGRSEITVDLDGTPRAGDVLEAVRARMKVPASVRIAVNAEYATPRARLERGDVVSLIPPVAGG